VSLAPAQQHQRHNVHSPIPLVKTPTSYTPPPPPPTLIDALWVTSPIMAAAMAVTAVAMVAMVAMQYGGGIIIIIAIIVVVVNIWDTMIMMAVG
jgi:hypothetical protein